MSSNPGSKHVRARPGFRLRAGRYYPEATADRSRADNLHAAGNAGSSPRHSRWAQFVRPEYAENRTLPPVLRNTPLGTRSLARPSPRVAGEVAFKTWKTHRGSCQGGSDLKRAASSASPSRSLSVSAGNGGCPAFLICFEAAPRYSQLSGHYFFSPHPTRRNSPSSSSVSRKSSRSR